MTKVLHVINGWALGGIAQVVLDCINNTNNVQHYAVGYCWKDTEMAKEYAKSKCTNIFTDENYSDFADIIKSFGIDVVHKQTGGGEFPEWVKLCKELNVPVIESLHCPRTSGIPKEFIARTICTTDYVINKNKDRGIVKIPYSCNLPIGEPRKHPWRDSKRRIKIGRVARYEIDKVPEIIASTAMFLQENIELLEFHIMGYPFNKELFESMQVYHNPPFINVLGLQPNKLEALKSLDICLDPVWETSFDIVMIEAMSQGIPVVTWNDSAAPEVCGDGGLVTERLSYKLSQAIMALVQDKNLYEHCSSRAINKIKTVHNPVLYGEKFDRLYAEVAND